MRDSARSEQISSCWDSIKTAEGVSFSRRLLRGVDFLEDPRQSVISGTGALCSLVGSVVGRGSFRALGPCGSKFYTLSQQMQDELCS